MQLRFDTGRLILDTWPRGTLLCGMVADNQAWHCAMVTEDPGSFPLPVQLPSHWTSVVQGGCKSTRHHIQIPKVHRFQLD